MTECKRQATRLWEGSTRSAQNHHFLLSSNCVLCIVCCVLRVACLCVVCYVLCVAYCLLCVVCRVLCFVCCLLCVVYVLCVVCAPLVMEIIGSENRPREC